MAFMFVLAPSFQLAPFGAEFVALCAAPNLKHIEHGQIDTTFSLFGPHLFQHIRADGMRAY
jgi:hypothetical protein